MKKTFFILAFLASALSFLQAWDISDGTATITGYGSTSMTTDVTFTVSRTGTAGKASFYILVSGTMIGTDYLPGTRKTFLAGNLNAGSLKVFVRPTNQTTEIGSVNQTGTMVVSGSINNNSSSTKVSIRVATGTGRVPAGTYTNTFVLQLYTGSAVPGQGTLQSGATGNLAVSVTSSTAQTFSIQMNPSSVSFGTGMVPDVAYTANSSMVITAPASFSVSARSMNNGFLIHTNTVDTIPYHFYFNNEPAEVVLGSGLVRILNSSVDIAGISYPLRFQTDPLGFIEPGTYSDTLYFMFTTQ